MNKSTKCKNYCKDLSYDYEYDEYGHIISNDSDVLYKCLRYNKILGNKPIKCKECNSNYENRGKRVIDE